MSQQATLDAKDILREILATAPGRDDFRLMLVVGGGALNDYWIERTDRYGAAMQAASRFLREQEDGK